MVPAIYDKGTHYVTNHRLTLESQVVCQITFQMSSLIRLNSLRIGVYLS